MRSNQLRAQRAAIVAQARAIQDKAVITAEEDAQFDTMMAEADAIQARIVKAERVEAMDAELALHRDVVRNDTGASADEQANGMAREKRIMVAWMTGRVSNLTDADRAVMVSRINATSGFENAGAVGTAGAGGYTIAPGFVRELLIAQKAFGGMRGVSRSLPTESAVDLPWPTMDDTSNVASIVGENTAGAAGADLAFGSKTLKGWTYRSGYLPLSIELMQDSAFDFDSLVRDALAMRFARAQNAHFTTGNGTTQPEGVVVGAGSGKVGATGQTTSAIYDDLIDLQHSVDPAYRPGSIFMMHDSSIKVFRKLKDGQGRPLWADQNDSIAGVGMSGTLCGSPVVVNQDMAVMAANAKSILFGNFSNYVIRDILGVRLLRLNELFATNGQVAFLGFQRTDGRTVSAVTPIKYYANSAT